MKAEIEITDKMLEEIIGRKIEKVISKKIDEYFGKDNSAKQTYEDVLERVMRQKVENLFPEENVYKLVLEKEDYILKLAVDRISERFVETLKNALCNDW